MPLILAIEPDRKQASQLTALVRGRLKAELVIGDTADRALAALGDRIPDLVLTAALLSPRDEEAIGQRLRQLNGVASHVQTLTIPMLASTSRSDDARGGGLLSALRRDKPKGGTEGCDPAVFAEQCKEYLVRAASDRKVGADHVVLPHASIAETTLQAADEDSAAFEEETPIASLAAVERTPAFVEPPVEQPVAREWSATASILREPPAAASIPPEPMTTSSILREPRVSEPMPAEPIRHAPIVSEPAAPPAVPARRKSRSLTDPLALDEGPASLVSALALFEADEEAARVQAPAHVETHASLEESVYVEVPAYVEEPAPVQAQAPAEEMDLSSLLDASVAGTRATAAAVRDEAVEVYEIDNTLLDQDGDQWFALDRPAATAPTIETAAEESAVPEAAAQNEPEHPQEWLDIIEALRRDAEQVPVRKAKAEPPPAPAPAPASASAPKQTSKPDAPPKKKRHNAGAPAQDEWGFFDPDQCGFAALLEKLQEVSSSE